MQKVHILYVPRDATVVSSHVLYKAKLNDNSQQYLKARIMPNGNRDRVKNMIRTDSASHRIVASIAYGENRKTGEIDFKSAFLQSGILLGIYILDHLWKM